MSPPGGHAFGSSARTAIKKDQRMESRSVRRWRKLAFGADHTQDQRDRATRRKILFNQLPPSLSGRRRGRRPARISGIWIIDPRLPAAGEEGISEGKMGMRLILTMIATTVMFKEGSGRGFC